MNQNEKSYEKKFDKKERTKVKLIPTGTIDWDIIETRINTELELLKFGEKEETITKLNDGKTAEIYTTRNFVDLQMYDNYCVIIYQEIEKTVVWEFNF